MTGCAVPLKRELQSESGAVAVPVVRFLHLKSGSEPSARFLVNGQELWLLIVVFMVIVRKVLLLIKVVLGFLFVLRAVLFHSTMLGAVRSLNSLFLS